MMSMSFVANLLFRPQNPINILQTRNGDATIQVGDFEGVDRDLCALDEDLDEELDELSNDDLELERIQNRHESLGSTSFHCILSFFMDFSSLLHSAESGHGGLTENSRVVEKHTRNTTAMSERP